MQPLLTLISQQDPHYTNSSASTASTPVQEHPDAIAWLSERVRPDGWPEQEATPAREQPWRKVWGGPQVSKDGRLIIACPKGYEWGKITYIALPLRLVATER